ncbi:hypothetical protein CYMTET_51576 [Cymbomonas tetramitiformis]|uniref:Fungal lipase-type domain-containing protein n=1 Tax=Cymbomonas tetramitiformis TaxID=36881 RepID=A0AAE0BKV6_9CHLO|nr:hypothetical protein CYMTET_51576 [Cymbomonas tetramitiformis]
MLTAYGMVTTARTASRRSSIANLGAILATTGVIPEEDEADFQLIAEKLQQVFDSMAILSVQDLTLGLYLLAARHQRLGDNDNIDGVRVQDPNLVKSLKQDCLYADAAYLETVEQICEKSGLTMEDVRVFHQVSKPFQPSHYLAVDSKNECVLLVVRGTFSAFDIVTDLTAVSEPFVSGYAHSGMLQAARWLKDAVSSKLQETMKQHPGFSLKVIGHSLGAGTAALLTFLLRSSPEFLVVVPPKKVSCVAFATPPVFSRELAEACQGFITTVVLQDDVVPRCSLANLRDLQLEALYTDIGEDLPEDHQAKTLLLSITKAREYASATSKEFEAFQGQLDKKVEGYKPFTPIGEGLKKMYLEKRAQSGRRKLEASQQADPVVITAERLKNMPEENTPLFAPGCLLQLVRSEGGTTFIQGGRGYHFTRIILSPTMVTDHLTDNYLGCLEDVLSKI